MKCVCGHRVCDSEEHEEGYETYQRSGIHVPGWVGSDLNKIIRATATADPASAIPTVDGVVAYFKELFGEESKAIKVTIAYSGGDALLFIGGDAAKVKALFNKLAH